MMSALVGFFLFALDCVQRGKKLAQPKGGPRRRRRDSLIAPWKVALGLGVMVWLMITQGLLVCKAMEVVLLLSCLSGKKFRGLVVSLDCVVSSDVKWAGRSIRGFSIKGVGSGNRMIMVAFMFLLIIDRVGAVGPEGGGSDVSVPLVLPAVVRAGHAGSEWVGSMFNKPRRGRQQMSFLRVAEYNVAKGLRGRVDEVYAEMLKLGLDIMVVTETGLLARDKIREADGFKVVSLPATQGSVVEGGIAIFVRRHKGLVVERVCADQERGRWIMVKFLSSQ
jgi:hypothetical protein